MRVIESDCILVDPENQTNVKCISVLNASRWGEHSRSTKIPRAVDLDTREIIHSPLISSSRHSAELTLIIETSCAYKVHCSYDSLILTEEGFKCVSELKIGDTIWVNGSPPDPRYMNEDWLRRVYLEEGRSQKEIAEICEVSPRTIRAYCAKFNLHREGSTQLFGENNPNYKEDISRKGGYERSYAMYRQLGIIKGKCALCDHEGNTQVHHINHDPSDIRPENFIELCGKCHRAEHIGKTIKHVRRDKISLIYTGPVAKTVEISTEVGDIIVEGFIFKT